ncbi:MAG TPA: methionyl-tRNA formyltransferase [Thermoanaerobacterales bacterium]|nr:methionyl-tRNA formyltransferase [Thermoanaerobacterales bacterium]
MKVVFMGTPDFAVPSLKYLIDSPLNLLCVITQPDRMRGRGRKTTPTPVKKVAIDAGIKTIQPEKVNDGKVMKVIKSMSPDIIVVAAYGQILSEELLGIPNIGCINVHASLLPKYRGAAPIHWAIINGEKETGITTMLMDKGMDTGDILLQEKLEITDNDTAGSLHDKLSEMGARVLRKTIDEIKQGKFAPIKQDDTKATYAPMLKKEDGLIKWTKDVEDIYNLVRGTNPWPGTFAFLGNNRLIIHKAEIYNKNKQNTKPGTITGLEKDEGIIVSCKNGEILLKSVQPSGKRVMSGWDYVLGYPIDIGESFC